MSDGMSIIVVLLVVIVILLCKKQEERGRTLIWWMLCAGAYFLIKYVGPLILGGGAWLLSKRDVFLTFVEGLGGLMLTAFAGYLVYGAWRDEGENRAVRSGSVEAFNKRVDYLMAHQGYTRERATDAAIRVRDEKSTLPIAVFVTGIALATGVAVFYSDARHYAIAAVFLGIDGFITYACISEWNPKETVREKLGTVLIAVSTACGVLAFILMCIPSVPPGPAGLLTAAAILTFFVGFLQPKSTEADCEGTLDRIAANVSNGSHRRASWEEIDPTGQTPRHP